MVILSTISTIKFKGENVTNSQEEKLVNRRRSIHDSKVRISENCKINTVNILKKIEIIKIHGQHE